MKEFFLISGFALALTSSVAIAKQEPAFSDSSTQPMSVEIQYPRNPSTADDPRVKTEELDRRESPSPSRSDLMNYDIRQRGQSQGESPAVESPSIFEDMLRQIRSAASKVADAFSRKSTTRDPSQAQDSETESQNDVVYDHQNGLKKLAGFVDIVKQVMVDGTTRLVQIIMGKGGSEKIARELAEQVAPVAPGTSVNFTTTTSNGVPFSYVGGELPNGANGIGLPQTTEQGSYGEAIPVNETGADLKDGQKIDSEEDPAKSSVAIESKGKKAGKNLSEDLFGDAFSNTDSNEPVKDEAKKEDEKKEEAKPEEAKKDDKAQTESEKKADAGAEKQENVDEGKDSETVSTTSDPAAEELKNIGTTESPASKALDVAKALTEKTSQVTQDAMSKDFESRSLNTTDDFSNADHSSLDHATPTTYIPPSPSVSPSAIPRNLASQDISEDLSDDVLSVFDRPKQPSNWYTTSRTIYPDSQGSVDRESQSPAGSVAQERQSDSSIPSAQEESPWYWKPVEWAQSGWNWAFGDDPAPTPPTPPATPAPALPPTEVAAGSIQDSSGKTSHERILNSEQERRREERHQRRRNTARQEITGENELIPGLDSDFFIPGVWKRDPRVIFNDLAIAENMSLIEFVDKYSGPCQSNPHEISNPVIRAMCGEMSRWARLNQVNSEVMAFVRRPLGICQGLLKDSGACQRIHALLQHYRKDGETPVQADASGSAHSLVQTPSESNGTVEKVSVASVQQDATVHEVHAHATSNSPGVPSGATPGTSAYFCSHLPKDFEKVTGKDAVEYLVLQTTMTCASADPTPFTEVYDETQRILASMTQAIAKETIQQSNELKEHIASLQEQIAGDMGEALLGIHKRHRDSIEKEKNASSKSVLEQLVDMTRSRIISGFRQITPGLTAHFKFKSDEGQIKFEDGTVSNIPTVEILQKLSEERSCPNRSQWMDYFTMLTSTTLNRVELLRLYEAMPSSEKSNLSDRIDRSYREWASNRKDPTLEEFEIVFLQSILNKKDKRSGYDPVWVPVQKAEAGLKVPRT